MKKLLFAFLFVILGFSLTTSGAFLLSGCSTSQSENGGGGNFAPPQNEDEDLNNSNNEETNDTKDDNEIGADWATELDVYVTVRLNGATAWDGDTEARSAAKFTISWHTKEGGQSPIAGINEHDGSATGAQVSGCSYVHLYDYNLFSHNFYEKVVSYSVTTGYQLNTTLPFYIYGENQTTTSETTAKNNAATKVKGTYYIEVSRKYYKLNYNANGGNVSPTYKSVQFKSSYGDLVTPTRTGYSFQGWYTAASGGTKVSSDTVMEASDTTIYAHWTANTYTITLNKQSGSGGTSTLYLKYNTGWYSNSGATTSVSSITKPSRTGYTFNGYYTETSGGTQIINSSGSIISGKTTYVAANDTLYARWSVNTYTLTIYYYGGTTRQTNTTNLNITASSCTVSSSSIASGSSATVKHTYTTTSYSVVLKLSNSASYDYYLRTGSGPTTSSYTKLYTTSSDSYTYTWKPDSNDSLYVYVKQRYTITYSANDGSGTLPSSDTYKYKIHGTALTLGTNSLTRTGYTANGWNTNTSGTGTHYASGGSYSTNASDTLYADWTPQVSTIKVQIKTSTDGTNYTNSVTGGTTSVSYFYDNNNTPTEQSWAWKADSSGGSLGTVATNVLISQTVTFTPSENSGYVFVGASTSSSPPNSSTATTFTPTTSGATYTINVYFKVLSSNQLKYDSTDKYWYFEHGEYPQNYVGTSMNNTLNSVSPTKSGEIKYNDGTTNQKIEVYTYNSKKYARLQATSTQTLKMSDGSSYTFTSGQYYWFEVEPIRWRVSDYGVSSTSYPSGWSTYGTYKTNFTVVSDRILTLGAVETSDVTEGWAFSTSDMYSNISGLNKTASTTNFSANITNKQATTGYTYYRFGDAGQQDKVVSVSVTEDGVRVASIEEIDDYLTDYSAKASDMVCFLLGCGTDDKVNYWTRNLGAGLGNGQIITKAGVTKSTWLDSVHGVRLALTMGNGSRI